MKHHPTQKYLMDGNSLNKTVQFNVLKYVTGRM